MNHQIILESELGQSFPYEELLKQCITAALEAENMQVDCEVDVLITDDEGIHQINLEQRQVDRATDVLSFPMFNLTPGVPVTMDSDDDAELDPATGLLPLGDMVISYQRAQAQAQEFGHSVQRELGYLAVHSVLHLLGYDHMDGEDGPMKRQMRSREEAIMNQLGITRD
jgi:probable rRNA maturation factor